VSGTGSMDEATRRQIAELVALGAGLHDNGQLAEAEELFAGLRAITRDDVQVNSRLGLLMATRGEFAGAIPVLQDAVVAAPHIPLLQNVLSVCAFETGDHAGALAAADAAIAAAPDFPEAWNSRGNALTRLGRDAEALDAFQAAGRLRPGDPVVLLNIANALRGLGRPDEALASLDQALALAPILAPAHANRGNVLQDLGRHPEAIASYDQAIALDPQSVDANWNGALCRLLTGDYAGGWRGHEWRWRRASPENRPRDFTAPLWLGQAPLAGRSILLHGEQGLGDCLQSARYIPQVAALGARVTVEIYAPLVELFRSLEGVEVIAAGAPLPQTDFQCPLMSLPLALGETGPPAPRGPYLAAPAARLAQWGARAPADGRLKVGLTVSGSATHGNDRRRSLPFATLAPFLPTGPAYHLLQKEIAPRDLEPLAARPDVTTWTGELGDLSDTAALAEQMDIVISVDTSIAHLAGALGRPTWILLPYDPDWRWGLVAETTPWYASARLYRQDARDDWTGVLARLQRDLAAAR